MEVWRSLPSVDEVLRGVAAPLLEVFPRPLVKQAIRSIIARHRDALHRVNGDGLPRQDAPSRIVVSVEELRAELVASEAPYLRRVINATGVVLHTNLGRAPLSARVLERVVECARGYANIEYDLERRARGSRSAAYAALLCELCGAEAALAVNNNAAAMLLALGAIATGGEVIVSRGELVEIGGSFRVPDILAQSGARLREVGTTNKTRLDDYEAAITPDTRAILKIHRSNFAIVGFTEEPSLAALAGLGRARGIPALFDLGSGALVDLTPYGLPGEVSVRAAVEAGFALVAFSGDKLMGGPQAGLLVGQKALVERLAKHPLHRALRLDRLRLAALEETLRLYRGGLRAARKHIPALEMLTFTPEELRARAKRLARLLRAAGKPHGFVVEVVPQTSTPGGGSYPLAELQTWAIALSHPRLSADELESALRRQALPVLCRVADGTVLFDPRTLLPEEAPLCARAVAAVEVSALEVPE